MNSPISPCQPFLIAHPSLQTTCHERPPHRATWGYSRLSYPTSQSFNILDVGCQNLWWGHHTPGGQYSRTSSWNIFSVLPSEYWVFHVGCSSLCGVARIRWSSSWVQTVDTLFFGSKWVQIGSSGGRGFQFKIYHFTIDTTISHLNFALFPHILLHLLTWL